MELMDAIYKCRAAGSFEETPVADNTLTKLLDAAVQAPSTMDQESWAFVVIQDKGLLHEYSNRAKRFLLGSLEAGSPLHDYRERLVDRDFNVFDGAATLVVICAKKGGAAAVEDCCLAAENLMLAAVEYGLVAQPVGLANAPSVKRELKIPDTYIAVMAITVGRLTPSTEQVVARQKPDIIAWMRPPKPDQVRELGPVNE